MRDCIQGAPKKVIPWEKFDISGIVANFFAKFTLFTEEDSGHILQISLDYLVAFKNITI